MADRHMHLVTGLPAPVPAPDAFSDIEQAVERIARLILHADALAVRMQSVPLGTSTADSREVRVQRLHAAVVAGQRAIQETIWLHADRRRAADRRAGRAQRPAV